MGGRFLDYLIGVIVGSVVVGLVFGAVAVLFGAGPEGIEVAQGMGGSVGAVLGILDVRQRRVQPTDAT